MNFFFINDYLVQVVFSFQIKNKNKNYFRKENFSYLGPRYPMWTDVTVLYKKYVSY